MGLTLITPAVSAAVTVPDVRDHLRIDQNVEDGVLYRLIQAATAFLDGPNGMLGRALALQTWKLSLDCFPDIIRLPLPPTRSVTEVKYLDVAGAEQVIAGSSYVVRGLGEDEATIQPAIGRYWPATAALAGAVTVTFTAGYDAVPEPIKQAIMLQVGTWYAAREGSVLSTASFQEIDAGVSDIVRAFQVWRF